MPSMKVRDVIRMLEHHGWQLDRSRGSHRVFRHPKKPGSVTVAGHPGEDLALGTLRNIFRQAELDWKQR